jgi:hypothetical protein
VSNTSTFRSNKERPVGLLYQARDHSFKEPTYKCFTLNNYLVDRRGVFYDAPRPDELAPHERGYYVGMKRLVDHVDALCQLNGRKRTLMDSIQGEVFYKAAEEWNNFDVMDIISLSLCAYPQLVRDGRLGLYAAVMK